MRALQGRRRPSSVTEKEDKTAIGGRISIQQYLEKVARFSGDEYGKLVRGQFKDSRGQSELAMLAAPSPEELEQLKRAVAIMTPREKETIDNLTDEQIQRIAKDAQADPANLAIFVNGYILHSKRVS